MPVLIRPLQNQLLRKVGFWNNKTNITLFHLKFVILFSQFYKSRYLLYRCVNVICNALNYSVIARSLWQGVQRRMVLVVNYFVFLNYHFLRCFFYIGPSAQLEAMIGQC